MIEFDLPFILQCAKFLLAFVPLCFIPILIWGERRGASLIQDRLGPNRANIPLLGGLRLFGLVQNAPDGIKLFTKESFIPKHAHKFWYIVAPMIPLCIAFLTPSVIPWFAPMAVEGAKGIANVSGQILDADAGVLVLFALSGLSVYGVVLGAWASNSKYALMGGMRASAMMISYEVSMGLSVAGIFLIVGSFSLTNIVEWQAAHVWGIVAQPLGFVMFLTSLFAETGRAPFDVAEGDSEIVAGYFLEYSAIRFGLYYMGEYAHIAIASALVSTVFLGGYHMPWLGTEVIRANLGLVGGGLLAAIALLCIWIAYASNRWSNIYAKMNATDAAQRKLEYRVMTGLFSGLAVLLLVAGSALALFVHPQQVSVGGTEIWPLWVNLGTAAIQLGIVVAKTLFICWVFIWVRWTLPRFRYDQVMGLGWKILLNIALVNLLVTAVVAKLVKG
ncbi:MAG TPA: NADH-quinone oxidoreductase subunit H [Fibrobacteria bacterium]|nr:NADH-quinone oxidoreductase subunit H [Fibrobacteria bacterium]